MATLIAVSGLRLGDAAADEAAASVEATGMATPVAFALGAPLAAILPTEDPKHAKLERQVRRNRRALIGTSVGTAVGLSLWMVATTRGCDGGFSQRTERVCTTSGKAVRTTGIVIFSGGLAGMLISGTMLSVRKQQLEDLGSLVQLRKSRVWWDTARSRFAF